MGREKSDYEWLGAIEIHENPARESHNHHWHMYIRFTSRLDISDRRHYGRFDITLADNTVAHPDIRLVNQGATDRMRTLTYVAKQQNRAGKTRKCTEGCSSRSRASHKCTGRTRRATRRPMITTWLPLKFRVQ